MDGFDHPSRNTIDVSSYNEEARQEAVWDVGPADAHRVEAMNGFDHPSRITLDAVSQNVSVSLHPTTPPQHQ